MRKAILCGWLCVAPVFTATTFASEVATATKARTADGGIAAQLKKYRRVNMPFATAGLSTRERQLVEKLAEATRHLDELFWQQSDPQGLLLYRSLAGSAKAEDQQLRRFLQINGGRYDLIREYAPFAGAPPRPLGGSVFPADLTKAEFDAYVAKNPQQKSALYSGVTVVERKGSELVAIPYHEAYRQWLAPMSKALEQAAALSDDPAFAHYLKLRAAALLTDDYYESDLAWLDLVNPKFDLIFAPYETYLDRFLGVKTSYGASVLIRNEAESRKLQVFQQFVPDIQDALPLPAEDRPSKKGHVSPMEVMDAPYRGGDLRHGYQAVADNLPNDPRVHEVKGSKKIFFKNFMDARVDHVILPIARQLMQPDQASLATADGYLTSTIMHEICHGLGPTFSRTKTGRVDIRAAIGPEYSGLEEAKADIVGLFALKWLADHGRYPASKLHEVYASDLAGIFRTVRFGVAEAHGRAEIMEFNFLTERGAIRFDAATGRYSVDFALMPQAIAALAQELLEQEATGDRARVESWFKKYGSMSTELSKALERVKEVPVDVDPQYDFHEL
jgi:Peptidase family M49